MTERGEWNHKLGAHTHHIYELEETVEALTDENDQLRRHVKKCETEMEELHLLVASLQAKCRELSAAAPQIERAVTTGQIPGASAALARSRTAPERASSPEEETMDMLRSCSSDDEPSSLKGQYQSKTPRRESSESTRAGSDAKSSTQLDVDEEEVTQLVSEVVERATPKARRLIQKLQDAGLITRRGESQGPTAKEKEQERALSGLRMESIAYQAKIVKMKEEIVKLHREVASMKTEVRSKSVVARELEAQRDELRAMMDALTGDLRRLKHELEAERMQTNELRRRGGSSSSICNEFGGAVKMGDRGRQDFLSALDDLDVYRPLEQVFSSEHEHDSEPETTGSAIRRQGKPTDYHHLYERSQAELEATRTQLQELLRRGGNDIEAELKRLKQDAELGEGEQKTPAEKMRELLSIARREVGLASIKLQRSVAAH